MTLDATFQAILLAGFLLVIPVALYHRIQSQSSREKLDRRQEGLFLLATLRPLGVILWVAVITYAISPPRMAWSSIALPDWLRWSGVGVCAAGAALLVWTLRSLGPNLTDTVVTRRVHTLVTYGPYRWVRHPFYDSAALLILAISLMAANWFLLLGGCVLMMLFVIRTRTEEEKLVARFGGHYQAYMAQTGRFLPSRRPKSLPGTTP
jgi:protein-S-isoprenylcysteine O-methyltransferase Ste14